eukprot:s320_g1.t1
MLLLELCSPKVWDTGEVVVLIQSFCWICSRLLKARNTATHGLRSSNETKDCRSIVHPSCWHYLVRKAGWSQLQCSRVGQLDGVWLNADCPWEYYTVSGQRVRRTNAQGTREFSIHWNPARLSWQWGRHGRLTMQWLGIDSIAWVPDMSFEHSRVWRWRRVCEHSRHARREHRSRSRSRNWHRCYRRARSEAPLPCGLTHREVYSLLSREITPEDYEMLLRLDETVPKKGKATEEETSEALHPVQSAPEVAPITHESKYTGVTWHPRLLRWQVHVRDPDMEALLSLGLFYAERDAAQAYDCAMIVLEGDAAVNFPKKYSRTEIATVERSMFDDWAPRPSA